MPPVFGQWARPVARFKPSPPRNSSVAALALPVGRWLHYQREWAETCVRAARVMGIPGHGPDSRPVPTHRLVGWDEALAAHALPGRAREIVDDDKELRDIVELERARGESAGLSVPA